MWQSTDGLFTDIKRHHSAERPASVETETTRYQDTDTNSEICMKSGSVPSDGWTKPWPFWRQNDTTVPENEGPAKILSDLQQQEQWCASTCYQ